MIKLIILSITLICVLILLIRDIVTYKEVKDTFTCKYCNTLNDNLHNGHQCCNCGRIFSNTIKVWDHRILFKIVCVDTSIKKISYNYKDIIRASLTEIIIYSVFVITLISSIVITLI